MCNLLMRLKNVVQNLKEVLGRAITVLLKPVSHKHFTFRYNSQKWWWGLLATSSEATLPTGGEGYIKLLEI